MGLLLLFIFADFVGITECYQPNNQNRNNFVFAARKHGGKLLTWGYSYAGGDSSAVAHILQTGVVSMSSTALACAAIKADGSVVTFGESRFHL